MYRLFNESGDRPEKSVSFDPSYNALVPIQSECDGVLVCSSEYKRVDTSEQNKEFSYTDFSLANIIAVGAYGQLSPVVMTNNSDITFVDQFTHSVASLPNIDDNA